MKEVGYIVIAGAISLVVIVVSVVLIVREARRRQVAALDAVSSEDYQPTVPVEEPEAESRVVDCENCRGLLLGAAGGGGGMPLLRLPPFLAGWRIAARVRDNASNGEPPPNRRGLFFTGS